MRTYTADSNKLESQIEKLMKAARNALSHEFSGSKLIDRVYFIIPTDKRYKECDFGGTAPALREKFADEDRVLIMEVDKGDNYVGILNAAFNRAFEDRMEFVIVNSPSAHGFFTEETAQAMCRLWKDKGATAVGVIIPESPHPTLVPKGLITNTLAGWDVEAVLVGGGFSRIAAIAPIGETNPNAGVEEIPVLILMHERFFPGTKFIGVVEPQGNFKPWQLPPEGTEDRANHERSHVTKLERMEAHALVLGVNLSVLEAAVIR